MDVDKEELGGRLGNFRSWEPCPLSPIASENSPSEPEGHGALFFLLQAVLGPPRSVGKMEPSAARDPQRSSTKTELPVRSSVPNGWGVWGGCRGKQPTVASKAMAISHNSK
jgi:hypothetical protein